MGAQSKVRDYGALSELWMHRLLPVVGTPMLAVAAVWLAADWTASWRAHEASVGRLAAEWTVEGPPCPVSAAEPSKTRYLMSFNGVDFGRRFGHAECVFVRGPDGRGPVCQFTSPDRLEVTTAKGVYRFTPGIGQPATVSVIGDAEPKCVMATTFELGRVMVGQRDE